MSELAAKIEAILFLSTRPVSYTKLAKLLAVKNMELKKAIEELSEARNIDGSGIHIVAGESAVELATSEDGLVHTIFSPSSKLHLRNDAQIADCWRGLISALFFLIRIFNS